MAPISVNTAAMPQKKGGRSAARIIPAIPHRLARVPAPVRPITPDESTTAAATTGGAEPQPTTEKGPDERAATPVQVPLTPDSNAVASGHMDESGLAASPARSADDLVEVDATRVQADYEISQQQHPVNEASSVPPSESETAQSNGLSRPTAPAELPPEFHPREKPSLQNPSVESTDVPSTAPSASLPAHRLQPSVEGLVFGGAVQDSPAMPSTPQEVDVDAHAPQQPFARPPPGFAPHLAPQFFPGHSHHPSDAGAAPWHYPAYSMAPPPEAIYSGHDFLQSSLSAVVPAYQAPFPSEFSPQHAPLALNGSRSHSQSPNKSQLGEELQHVPYANGHASRPHEISQDGYDIAKHLSTLFGNPEFSDYILHIRSPDTMLLSLPVHAALVSRSPTILEAIHRSAPPAYRTKDLRRHADILTYDQFVTPESMHEALKILYAAPLLPVQSFLFGLGAYDGNEQSVVFAEARRRMGQAISYAAAGRMLQIPEMYACGSRIVKALLRWDTVDQAIHFGLETGTSSGKHTPVGPDNQIADLYAAPALEDALEFVAYNFPTDFSLYALAPELRHSPRLPTPINPKQLTHNPRLSKIRFGDAPPETDLMPNHVARILSSILLSLPLPLLDRLFNHHAAANQVGWSGLAKIMQHVVEEREKRRQKASKSQLRGSAEGAAPASLLENLDLEEKAEPTQERPSGYRLTASRLRDRA